MLNELLALVTSVSLAGANPAATAPARPATGVTSPLAGWLAWLGGAAPTAPGSAPTAAPAAATATEAPTASAVVDKVQAFYVGIKQVSAKFRQSVVYATFGGAPKTSDGKVYIAKPGKMRWDYYSKKGATSRAKKSFISNGAYLYVVEYDNKQILKKSLEKDLMPVAVSFLYGKGDLKADFNAELDSSGKYGAKGALVLKLTPKKPSAQYKNLFLVVDPKDFHVTHSVIIDSSNNTNEFAFYAPNFEKPLQDAWFEFNEKADAVKNFRVVDANAEDKAQTNANDLATPATGTRSAKVPLDLPAPQPIKPAPQVK